MHKIWLGGWVLGSVLAMEPVVADSGTEPEAVALPLLETVSFGPSGPSHEHKALHPETFKQVADISRRPQDVPPPVRRTGPATVQVELTAREVIAEIAPGISYPYWTFNDTVPGPMLRVRVSDIVELKLTNDLSSTHEHDIDLHAVTGPGGGAPLTRVKPGESKSFRFKALKPGLYVYHCAAGDPPVHVANGMYGLILVEPEGGLPEVDREFYLVQGEFYTQGLMGEKGLQPFSRTKMLEERPDYIVFNGRIGALVDHPLTAQVGEKIRLFIGNAGVAKISSFHVIGEIFDRVWPEASTAQPFENVQTTLIPAGGAAMIEFKLEVPGSYTLVDHALGRMDRGAWGVLQVEGPADEELYSRLPVKEKQAPGGIKLISP
ncbi:copper-containing nitrite reductase [Methylothermus subterraneus]